MIDGGSGVRIISVYGTPIPTGTTDQVNSYLREAAITVAEVPGLSARSLLSAQEKSGQDNSQGQASESTRKHYEHRYNITMTCTKYYKLMTSVTMKLRCVQPSYL